MYHQFHFNLKKEIILVFSGVRILSQLPKGDTQEEGIDFFETYFYVEKLTTIQL